MLGWSGLWADDSARSTLRQFPLGDLPLRAPLRSIVFLQRPLTAPLRSTQFLALSAPLTLRSHALPGKLWHFLVLQYCQLYTTEGLLTYFTCVYTELKFHVLDYECHFANTHYVQCYHRWVFPTRYGFIRSCLGFWVFFGKSGLFHKGA